MAGSLQVLVLGEICLLLSVEVPVGAPGRHRGRGGQGVEADAAAAERHPLSQASTKAGAAPIKTTETKPQQNFLATGKEIVKQSFDFVV